MLNSLEAVLGREILEEIHQSITPWINNSTISDYEFRIWGVQSTRLFESGRYQEVVEMTIEKLERHTRQDVRRSELLSGFSRALLRLRRFPEALRAVNEAIWLAHQGNDDFWLVMMLDLRSEIHCFVGDIPKALRTLSASEEYLRQGHINNQFLEAWIAHSLGMAYTGCGWWKKAETNLRNAIPIMQDSRNWDEWAKTLSDFGVLALKRAEAEGPDPLLLQRSLDLFDSAHNQFELLNNLSLTILVRIHRLMIQGILADLGEDVRTLEKVHDGFLRLMKQYGPRGFFKLPANYDNMRDWTVGFCRAGRALVALDVPVRRRREVLDEQERILQRGLVSSPRTLFLWHEKAALHLCRALHLCGQDKGEHPILVNLLRKLTRILRKLTRILGIQGIIESVMGKNGMLPDKGQNREAEIREAARCMEKAMDILRSLAGDYTDPQVRAGWFNTFNIVLESLASTAYFALNNELPEIASRMISFAQILRAQSRQDLVRSFDPFNQTPTEEIEEILTKIRYLQSWKDCFKRLEAEQEKLNDLDEENNFLKHRSRNICFDDEEEIIEDDVSAKINQVSAQINQVSAQINQVSAQINQVSTNILGKYPEYQSFLFVSSRQSADQLEAYRGQYEQVQETINTLRNELEHRVSGKTLIQMQSAKVEIDTSYDISTLQANLRDGDIVLDYYVGPSKLHVGVIGRNCLKVLHLPVENMRDLHDVARELSSSSESSLAERMQKCSRWLFPKKLVDLLKVANRLYIVASGPLWQIPFPWLNADGRLALERWQVCLVPSSKMAGRDERDEIIGSSFSALVVGHPGDPYLDNVKPDVKEVATLLGVDYRFNATPQEVLDQVIRSNPDIIHFSCHGYSDSVSPLTSCLLLEPDREHPDGRLMLYQLLISTYLQAKVISLSACYTARSEGLVSFPESLAHVLLGMGAKSVVASLWAANDEECLNFDRDFYTFLRDKSDPVEAFNLAQKEQVKRLHTSGKPDDLSKYANFVLLSARKELIDMDT